MLRTCILTRKGRFVVAEPYFEPGDPISLAQPKRWASDAGHLAVVSTNGVSGRVVELLGAEDDIRAVMRGLLAEHGALGGPPPATGMFGDPPVDVQVQVDNFGNDVPLLDERLDLRGQLCVTIDPPDARDHDDAIGLERSDEVPRGGAVVWVHIADVSAYVPVGSALDRYAEDRAMSLYVPGMVAAMLPTRLSSDLCSLRAGVDRGCLSARLALDADRDVVSASFHRTVIRSARRLTYDHVDGVLAGDQAIDPDVDDLLRELAAITVTLRARRLRKGALAMELPETEFELHEVVPHEAVAAAESPSHSLVEECMLLANHQVGQRLAEAERPGIYRIHDDPDSEAVEALLRTFIRLGVPTPPVPDDMTGKDAARVAAAAVKTATEYAHTSGRGRNTFPQLVLRALKQANYRAHEGWHSGLAMHNYVHFTSPIRRYPDLVNHRSLIALIEHAARDDDQFAPVTLPDVAEHVSVTEREYMQIERRADKIVLAHLLHGKLMKGETGRSTGEIVGMIGAGAFVRFADVFEGFVPARTLSSGERHEIDEHGIALVGTKSGERIQLGDAIVVEVVRVNRANGKVDLRRVKPGEDEGDESDAGTGTAYRANQQGTGGRGRGQGSAPAQGAGGRNRAARRRAGKGGGKGAGKSGGKSGGKGPGKGSGGSGRGKRR